MTRAKKKNWRSAGLVSRVQDARQDLPDARDHFYEPSLRPTALHLDPRLSTSNGSWWSPELVRDQGQDPSCTGHAVASATDMLLKIEQAMNGAGKVRRRFMEHGIPFASAIMIYGNARLHDEWPGEGYAGSSLRGALKGFQHNGVCSIETARLTGWRDAIGDKAAWRWHAEGRVQTEATETVLGNYRRIKPRLDDLHTALSEVQVLVATARIHEGWSALASGEIPFDTDTSIADVNEARLHAFVVIGYNQVGFIIQNSWGQAWGDDGTAIWSYADWATNVLDIWAMKLGVFAAQAFPHAAGPQGLARAGETNTSKPTRLDVLGRFVPISGGRFQSHGRYHIDKRDIENIATFVASAKAEGDQRSTAPDRKRKANGFKYHHVLLYFMGGTRTITDAATAVRAVSPRYEQQGIYPIFLIWEDRLISEIREQVYRAIDEVCEQVGEEDDYNPHVARLVEQKVAEVPGRFGATLVDTIRDVFGKPSRGGARTLDDGAVFFKTLLEGLERRHSAGTLSYHVAAHDIGARFVAEFFAHDAASAFSIKPLISSLHLVSPLMTRRAFETMIAPCLTQRQSGRVIRRARRDGPLIEACRLYCLPESLAAVDRFSAGYPRSWPELWAKAMPLVPYGEERHSEWIDGGSSEQRARVLALAVYAGELATALDRCGTDTKLVELHEEPKERLGRLSHFELDAADATTEAIITHISSRSGNKGTSPG